MSKEGVNLTYLVFSIVFAFLMGAVVIVIRMKAQQFPVNEKKLSYHHFSWLPVH